VNKRQAKARKDKIPIPWRLYLVAGFVTLLIVGAMVYILQQTKDISGSHDPLLVNVSEIKLKVTTAHLWLEEILSGDTNVNIETVRELLDQAHDSLHIIIGKKLHVTQSLQSNVIPGILEHHDQFHIYHTSHVYRLIKEPLKITDDTLDELQDVLEKRYMAAQTSGPGTEIEQRFDRISSEFHQRTDDIMKKIADSKADHLAEFRIIQTSLIFICLILGALVIVILHRFERQRAVDLLKVLRAEEALRESEKRYQVLFEHAGDGIFLLEAEEEKLGDILETNQAAAKMHGYPVDELLGLNLFRDLYTPDISKKALTHAKGLMNGQWIKAEIARRRKDGSVFPVEIHSGLVEFNDRTYILTIDRDISERKKIEEHLQRAEQTKLVGEWALGLAQEIRNPLAGIRVSIEVLLKDVDISTEDKTIVLKAVEETNRIERLLKNLLLFAKPHRLQPSNVCINDLLDKTMSLALQHPVLSSAPSRKIKVAKRFAENIPVLTADPMQLQQAFLNLLVNGMESMTDGGVLAVKTLYDEKAQTIQIQISDTGKGIDRKMIDDVFKPFFTTKPKRSGLGLAIARRIVEEHSGVISVKSDPNKGTTFNVYLPRISSRDKKRI
jgi:PAS domain S-box-containing protein